MLESNATLKSPVFRLILSAALCLAVSCTEPDVNRPPVNEKLVDLDDGIYHAVKEFYSPTAYSLYPKTYEGGNQGIDLAQFGFQFLKDSIILYALPHSDVSCLKRISAASIDSVTDSSFILRPLKTTGFHLRFDTPDPGYPGFRISLVVRFRGEESIANTYPYVPYKSRQDSVCVNDTVDFVWDAGD